MIPDILKPLLDRPYPKRVNLFEDDPDAPRKSRRRVYRTPGIAASQQTIPRPRHSTIFVPENDGLPRLIREKRVLDEVIAENARTVSAALKTGDHHDLAKVHAAAVRDFGDPALAEVADFRDQLHKANPRAAQNWLAAMKQELPAETERMEKVLKQVEKEDADEKAVKATNDGLRDALDTGRPSEQGETQVAFAPAVLLVPEVTAMTLAAATAAGIVTQQNAGEIAAAAKAGQRWAIDKLGELFGRTDIADPLPTTETFPEDKTEPKHGKETFPQADLLPPLPPSERQTIDTVTETLPDQSSEFDDLDIVTFKWLPKPVDRRKGDRLPEVVGQKLGTLVRDPETRRFLEGRVLGDGVIHLADKTGAESITDRAPEDVHRHFDETVRGLGGNPADARNTETGGRQWVSPNENMTVNLHGSSSSEGVPTLEIHLKDVDDLKNDEKWLKLKVRLGVRDEHGRIHPFDRPATRPGR